jgi:serine/threonine protein kinase
MITSYDVEFGNQIGSGGFAKVFKGRWNQTTVALKVFVTEDGVTPSSIAIRHEIKMWSKIRHPNVLLSWCERSGRQTIHRDAVSQKWECSRLPP